jgi:hypothetical protein
MKFKASKRSNIQSTAQEFTVITAKRSQTGNKSISIACRATVVKQRLLQAPRTRYVVIYLIVTVFEILAE